MGDKRSFQYGGRINWKNAALTRGLRNVIMADVTGDIDSVRDLVDANCYMVAVPSPTLSAPQAKIQPDCNFYANQYTPGQWVLRGETHAKLYYDRDFSILVRTLALAADSATRTLWTTTEGYFQLKGWVLNANVNDYSITFGYWRSPGLASCSISGVPTYDRFQTLVFVWDGSRQEFFMVGNGGRMWPVTDYAAVGGLPWPGSIGGGYPGTEWGSYDVGYTNRVYMWESALTVQAATQLAENPGAIFESSPMIYVPQAGTVVVPPVTGATHPHHHILGAV
jgi:hypothetical protein